jgi:hypothetical protein
MVDLKDAVSLLRAKRKELMDQLEAVDKALSVLSGVAGTVAVLPERAVSPERVAPEANPPEASDVQPNEVLPTRLNSPRILSDEHRHALKEGRRKARHSKDAAAGLAREMTDPTPGLASASHARSQPPRLVKRTKP